MELKRVLICVALMALVTYIPRVLPVTVFRKQIRSRFIRSFLDYTPYAVLGALTVPDVFFSTGHLFSAAGGTAVAIVLGYKGKSLVVVAVAAIAAVYILERRAGSALERWKGRQRKVGYKTGYQTEYKGRNEEETMITLRGAEVSEKLKTQVQESLNGLGRVPRLAIVRVGESPDDISYEKGAVKKRAAFGLEAVKYTFPENIPDQEFKTAFGRINSDPKIDGILVFRPLPEQIVQEDIDRMIDPLKDLDGISPVNIAKVFSGDNTGFAPCTAEAVMDILRFNGISLAGKRAVIVGRSMVVGRPLAMLFLQENATVTVCHTKTVDLPQLCRSADILVVAAGCANMVDKSFVKPGAVVIDVGINVDENGKLCGDVDFKDIQETASMATPVPGGVGSVTTSVLAKRLVHAAQLQNKEA